MTYNCYLLDSNLYVAFDSNCADIVVPIIGIKVIMKALDSLISKLYCELQNSFKFKTLFLLGAGVSARYIPPTYALYEKAKKEISKLMLIPVPGRQLDLTKEEQIRLSILGSKHTLNPTPDGKLLIEQTNIDFYDEILHHYPEFLETICALTYSLDNYPKYCPEYQLLNYCNETSIIANLNHDNLAETFIKQCKIISLHGSISPEMKKSISEALPSLLHFNLKNNYFKNHIFATQENESILLKSPNYISFIKELELDKFQNIIVIGYSFFKKNDFDIYDIVTGDIIRSYIKNNLCKIIIIDPKPEFTASVLGISHASCYPIYWDRFCRAFFLIQNLKKDPSWKLDSIEVRRFVRFYDYLQCCNVNNIYKINSFTTFRKSIL